jgi:DGQHR domain-containing protein
MSNKSVGPFPVLEVAQKGGSFFCASIPAEELVAITYSDVRRLVRDERDVERYLGIQRPLNRARVKEIRQYILSPDPTFTTAVIVAVDERCVEYDPDTKLMALKPYVAQDEEETSYPFDRIAKVLAGQHRLAGFLNEKDEYDIGGRPFDINVSIFVGADPSVQAQISATVNLAQTKVSKSLVYYLEDLSEVRSPFKTSHNIAVALDNLPNGPLHRRIKRLGFVTPGRTNETITQAAFVEALTNLISRDPFGDRNALLDGKTLERAKGKEEQRTPFRNLFLDGEDFDIADNVNNLFEAVRMKWPKAWEETRKKSSILPKTNAFRALMRWLRDVYPFLSDMEGDNVVSSETYHKALVAVKLEDADLTTKTFKLGSSGEAAFYKVLSGKAPPEDLFEPMQQPLDE